MSERKKTDGKPIKLKVLKTLKKKHKETSSCTCIIHYSQNKSDCQVRKLSETSFKKIQDIVSLRRLRESANERLDDICAQVPEVFYPHLHGIHLGATKTLPTHLDYLNAMHHRNTMRFVTQRKNEPQVLQQAVFYYLLINASFVKRTVSRHMNWRKS